MGNIGGTLIFTIAFAEKVLLPCNVRQKMGQPQFVTGIKLDLFDVTSSTFNINFVFGLTEGYWTGGKTANEVFSVLLFHIHVHRSGSVNYSMGLYIHADNCAGENKNC